MKIQRTGITEAILQFDMWLGDRPKFAHVEAEFINWLYSSSGWYDKTISGSYFDIDTDMVKRSVVYQDWKQQFRQSLLDCDYLEIMLWNKWIDAYFPEKHGLYTEFVTSFQAKDNSLNESSPLYNYWDNPEKMFPFLKGKVLIVNPMAQLMVEQYDNAHIVYPDMPDFTLSTYSFPYCFFNGAEAPDQNGFETLDRVFSELPKDFDIAIISVGPYGCILADRLHKLGKSVMTVGSGLPKLFAIEPKSTKPHWLGTIPKEYIPNNYIKIEGGRYWNGSNE